MREPRSTAREPVVLHRLKDVAAMFDVSLRTIQAWRSSGRLRVHVLGHVVRVAQSEVDRLLRESRS